MTLTEAADRLGVSPSTLRVQLWKGKLRGVKRGRDWWITPAEVERYASEHGRKVRRCPSRHPSHPKQVRCEEEAGHSGPHYHSFYARVWDDDPGHPAYVPPPEHRCNNRSCVAGCRERKAR